MRTLKRNEVKMYYALLIGEDDEYELDEDGNKIPLYTDSEGNVIYQMTGEKVLVYSDPVEFYANFSMSGGETEAVQFGIDVSNYDAVISTVLGSLPLAETSLIWHQNEPEYRDADKTILNANSADFRVVKIADTLNVRKYVLKAVVK